MNLGQKVLAKINNQIEECEVIKIGYEDLELKRSNGEIISRKFWEIRKITP